MARFSHTYAAQVEKLNKAGPRNVEEKVWFNKEAGERRRVMCFAQGRNNLPAEKKTRN